MEETEIEEQRYGRNKDTQINLSYIDSGEYRRKFDLLSGDPELNKLIYQLAKKILKHRSGTKFEDMYWINSETKSVVAQVIDSCIEGKIVYPEHVKKAIKNYEKLITVHSHPAGLAPSIADFNSNYEQNYYLGIVVGHNGKVFTYSSNEFISEEYFDLKVAMFKKKGYNPIFDSLNARNRSNYAETSH